MIDRFRNKYFFLSNFSPCKVIYNGRRYASVEHAFQAAKCVNDEEQELFLFVDTPADAKQWGKQVKLRPDWESVKVSIMKELLRQKFGHPKYNSMLKETIGEEIVEGNTHGDTFWGVCKGKGDNMLGKLIMEIREEMFGK